MNLEQLGLLGVFLAGAIPWFEAIAVIPAGIIFGLEPIPVVSAAVLGNVLTIFLFAYSGARIRTWLIERRRQRGKLGESRSFEKAKLAFDKYGIYGVAFLGPIIIGTQFAAAISVAAGVKPMRTSIIISAGMVIWAVIIAAVMVALGADRFLELTSLG